MSNPKLQAAHDLRKLSVMLKGILAVGEDLERLGSLEQAEQEMRSRVATLTDQEARLTVSLATVTSGLGAAKAQADQVIQTAREGAKEIRRKATEQATEIVHQAERTAAQSRSEAADERASWVSACGQRQAELVELDHGVTTRRTELATIMDEIAAVKARLG